MVSSTDRKSEVSSDFHIDPVAYETVGTDSPSTESPSQMDMNCIVLLSPVVVNTPVASPVAAPVPPTPVVTEEELIGTLPMDLISVATGVEENRGRTLRSRPVPKPKRLNTKGNRPRAAAVREKPARQQPVRENPVRQCTVKLTLPNVPFYKARFLDDYVLSTVDAEVEPIVDDFYWVPVPASVQAAIAAQAAASDCDSTAAGRESSPEPSPGE